MMELVNLVYSFLVNDIFGSIWIFATIMTIMFLAILLIGKLPRMALVLLPLMFINTLSTNAYIIPQWISVLLWIALGMIWGTIMWTFLAR